MSQRRCGWCHPLLTSVGEAAGANLKNNAYLSLTGQEKAVLGRSVLADCFDSLPGASEVLRRNTAAETLPPGSFGAWRRALCGRADPRAILRIRRGPVAPLPKSESGRKTGCTRVRPGLRLLSRTFRRPGRWIPRKHSSRPIQEQAQGSTGPRKLATASLRRGLRQRNKALRSTVASGVGRGFANHPPTRRSGLKRREGNAHR